MNRHKVVFVSHFLPSDIGHGGNHRTYQILHDLGSVLGHENVVLVSYPEWQRSQPSSSLILRLVSKFRRGLSYGAENPYKLLAYTDYTTKRYADSRFLAHYKRTIQDMDPQSCIIEHTGFSSLIPLNSQRGIPTISCIQNIEAFDSVYEDSDHIGKWRALAKSLDFTNEFRVLARCAKRLFISKTETSLIGGLGLASLYYPYLPVGWIRHRLHVVAQERLKRNIERGLFLLIGTSDHPTTRESFKWFVQNAKEHGLARGVRVVVIGLGTEKLLPPGSVVDGLELRGWIEQDDLDQLLVRANAVLSPHRGGFGALTRLSEMACARIPVITNRHATYAIDPPPNIRVAEDDWTGWCNNMEMLAQTSADLREDDYREWEERQPNPLKPLVETPWHE